jgi:hypothetical protein
MSPCKLTARNSFFFQNVAMASVFLASKLEEKQKKVKDIVNVFLRLDQQQSGRVGPVDGLNSVRRIVSENNHVTYILTLIL